MTSLSDKCFIDFGDIRLPIQIKKHRTSRKLTVRYHPLRKCLALTLPQYVSIKQGLHFVSEKQEWILQQISHYNNYTSFSDGQVLPIFGKDIRLEHRGGRGIISEEDDVWLIHGDIEFIHRRVHKFICSKLEIEVSKLAEGFARQIGVKIKNITLRDTTSHWGSCSANGHLSFSWRLSFAPYEVLEYVVAHEVAHIREHNHSPDFWNLVAQIYPDFRKSKDWLKLNGKDLYKYGVS